MADTSATTPIKRKTRGPGKKTLAGKKTVGRPKVADTGSTVSSSRSRTHVNISMPRELAEELFLHISEVLISRGSQQGNSASS